MKSKEEYYNEIQEIVKVKNGILLTKSYTNAHSKLEILCSEGHKFNPTPNRLKNGNWCTICSKIKYNIEDLKETASQFDGECLSSEYNGYKNLYRWECKNGHEWEDTYYNVKNFRLWCKECKRLSTKLSWRVIKDKIRRKGGYLLSGKPIYISEKAYLRIRCANGHEFKRTIADLIYKNDRWCRECNRERIKKSEYYKIRKIASEREYIMVETYDSYKNKNNREKLEFICKNNHVWKCSSNNFKRNRTCKSCSLMEKRIKEKDIKMLACGRGGRVLTPYEEYRESKQKLLWECSVGHAFHLSLDSATRGSWCPICTSRLVNETKCKYIIEQLTGHLFHKNRKELNKKVSSEITNFLELDMFNKDLELALEYNGEQHYRFTSYFHQTEEEFKRQLERDDIKRRTCKHLNIKLITVPYYVQRDEEKINYIKKELVNLKVPIVSKDVDMEVFYRTNSFNK